MAREKTIYRCVECNETFLKWMGQCSYCKAWNSLEEETESLKPAKKNNGKKKAAVDVIKPEKNQPVLPRLKTAFTELDTLLGDGIVPGSVVLLGGEPGVGKSTLLLGLLNDSIKSLYICGEESVEQVSARAARVNARTTNLKLVRETEVNSLIDLLQKEKPQLALVDSIQTIYEAGRGSYAGSVAQIRESAARLLEFAKNNNCAVIMTGHITKDGQIAGPRLLEHAVDVVLYFETHRWGQMRFIRAVKNRFGSTGEIAVFEMTETGLNQIEADKKLLSIEDVGGVGSVLFPQVEGSRVVPLEIQVLVTPTGFSNGRRIGENIEVSKIHLMAAILEKYMSYRLSQCDIFVRVHGGTSLHDPAADLALLAAMASSYLDIPFEGVTAAAGEISLTGKIRAGAHKQLRQKAVAAMQIDRVWWGGKPDNKNGAASYVSEVTGFIEKLFGKKKYTDVKFTGTEQKN